MTTPLRAGRAREGNPFATSRPGRMGPPIRWRPPWPLLLLLVLALVHAPLVQGASDSPEVEVLLLAGEGTGVYREVAQTVQDRATGRPWRFLALDEDSLDEIMVNLRERPPGLLVTLGRKAALDVPRLGYQGPVLYALIPEALYRGLPGCCGRAEGNAAATAGVLLLDQPLERQMRLIAAALPHRPRVGVLLGPESRWARTGLERAAREADLTLRVREIDTATRLGPVFRELVEEVDVLLAVPDPVVHNRDTVTALLLGSYQAGVPLVAFSETYVRAGALLAVYSTPEQIGAQIGAQIAEVLETFSASGFARLPEPVHPTRFSVAINPNVARSLRIDIPDARTLEGRIRDREP